MHLDPTRRWRRRARSTSAAATGSRSAPLHGVPVAIKDIFDTADYKTECGSPLLKGRQPMRDAAAVARLRAAGAVIIGKTVTTEFAYFHPGPTRNPHDPQRTPGGSSSGSAAAVAAGMVPLAIGSQTNGSMIRPAAFCGVYGSEADAMASSRAHGALILSRALDHVGVFARTLADAALILEVLAGYDADDSGYARRGGAGVSRNACRSNRRCRRKSPSCARRCGTRPTAKPAPPSRPWSSGWAGAATTVDLPDAYAAAWDDHRVVMSVDMAHNLGAVVERGGEASSKQLRDFLAEGRGVSAVRYLAARDNARRYAAGIDEIFKQYDAILTPAAPGVAPKGEATGNPVFCSLWTLTGLPALSLPLLTGEGGMPLGVQLIGERGDDARLMRTANWLIEEAHERIKFSELPRGYFLKRVTIGFQSSPQKPQSIKARPIRQQIHSGGAASLAAISRM